MRRCRSRSTRSFRATRTGSVCTTSWRCRASAPAPGEAVDRGGYELVQDAERLEAWVRAGLAAGIVAVDTETDGLRPSSAKLVGVSLATGPGRACYVPLGHVDPASAAEGELDLSGSAPKQLSF